jgi:hypothetical protein
MLVMSLRAIANRLFLPGVATLCLAAFLWAGHSQIGNTNRPISRLVRQAVAQGATHFAIADFDGDLQPDLAMVRVTRDGSPNSQYSVDLTFSSGHKPPIWIVGPSGGLQITPQDVNGDKFADLVVTSLLDSQFVAIFLNDGKGNFALADPSEFPAAGKRTAFHLFAPFDNPTSQLPLQQSRGPQGEEGATADWRKPREVSAGGRPGSPLSVGSVLAFASAGRAPPFV